METEYEMIIDEKTMYREQRQWKYAKWGAYNFVRDSFGQVIEDCCIRSFFVIKCIKIAHI